MAAVPGPVPPIPENAVIVVPLKSMSVKTGMLSRMVLKSRESMVPVSIKLVTVLFSVSVRAENKSPAVTFSVFETCAFSINEMLTPTKSKIIRFIFLIFYGLFIYSKSTEIKLLRK
jgi:hypothetical protein